MKRLNTIERMLSIIESIKVNEEGCKIWPMGINSSGYGHFSIKDKSYNVSRLLYKTLNPGDYTGMVVRHKCDNRSCCNIEHLEIGTQRDNIQDASNRRRLRVGEENNKSIFTNHQIVEIRSKYPEKSTVEIAREYNSSASVIRSIIIGKTWKHIPGAKKLLEHRSPKGEKSGRSKLTQKQVLEIRASYPKKNGVELAKEYSVSHHNIYCIIKRKNWSHI